MPIGRKRLTAKTVENLKLPAPDPTGRKNARRFVMDNEVSGLGVKITEAGSKSYVMIKRFPGFRHPAPRQLGSCDAMTLEEAREKGREWLKLIARGVDPAEQEREDTACCGTPAREFGCGRVRRFRQGKARRRAAGQGR